MNKFITSLFIGSLVFSLVLVDVVWADSTIGTNISTTGTLSTTSTFTVTTDSATGVRFQNAAGTNLLVFDHAKTRLGIGAAPTTTFEVQGTASASYFLSANAVQFGSIAASVAYSRFGSSTTNHANYISAADDLLVSGDVEIRGSASFGSTASVSGIFFMNDGRHRPNANSATAFRFQNTAGTTDVLTIDTTNTRVGVNAGGAVDTTFEVGGAASISGRIDLGSNASISGNFELTGSSALFGLNAGRVIDTALEIGGAASISGNVSASGRFELTSSAARFGLNAGNFTDTAFEVGGTGSVSTLFATTKIVAGSGTASASAYTAEFVSTGTTSVLFGGSSTTLGSCLQLKNTTGQPVYARVVGTTWTVSAVSCR